MRDQYLNENIISKIGSKATQAFVDNAKSSGRVINNTKLGNKAINKYSNTRANEFVLSRQVKKRGKEKGWSPEKTQAVTNRVLGRKDIKKKCAERTFGGIVGNAPAYAAFALPLVGTVSSLTVAKASDKANQAIIKHQEKKKEQIKEVYKQAIKDAFYDVINEYYFDDEY